MLLWSLILAVSIHSALSDPQTNEVENTSHKVELSKGCPINTSRPCVPKCCNIDESHANRMEGSPDQPECVPKNPNAEFRVAFSDSSDLAETLPEVSRYEYFIGNPCLSGKFMLDPTNYEEDAYSIYTNGSILYKGNQYGISDYCVDLVSDKVEVFFCFESEKMQSARLHVLFPICQFISILLLLVTACVYIIIEENRDVQGYTLACLVLSLAVAYFFSAYVQIAGTEINSAFCTASAYIIHYFFTSSFFWLNALSFDCYHDIATKSLKDKGRREKLLYSLYALIGPGILLAIIALIENLAASTDEIIKPEFGESLCWLSSEKSALAYYLGPVMILLAVSTIWILLSWFKIRTVIPDDYVKRWLKQGTGVFVIMTLGWLAEIISWPVGGPQIIWLIYDTQHVLKSFSIFVVCVCVPGEVRESIQEYFQSFYTQVPV